MQNYQYPFNDEWSQEEIVKVIKMWNALETAYEQGIASETLQAVYKEFKTVVPSKGEEKRLGNEFEKVSGYSLYQVVQKMRQKESGTIKMN